MFLFRYFYHIQIIHSLRLFFTNFRKVIKYTNLFMTVQKYRFNRLLTKDPSEITSLEYK